MSKKVILVEDDLDDRELFLTFFADRTDIDLLPSVSNGLELIEVLVNTKSDDHLPDLIIIDQNMPKMNGKQTLAFLKSNKRFANIPAVIYSTYADTSLVISCKELGAEMVAIKPIDHDGYQKMMDDFLQVLKIQRTEKSAKDTR